MCGRYAIRRVDRPFPGWEPDNFETFDDKRIVPKFNIAPGQQVPVVRLDARDARNLGLIKWGLIPHWTQGKPKTIPKNARADKVATSGMYKDAFDRRRCLVPADGFYEWNEKTEQPMFIRLKDDSGFVFAGIWERWKKDDETPAIDTLAIITTESNELMAHFHHRMPVILPTGAHARWLDRSVPGADVQNLLTPYDASAMEAWPVSTDVNSWKIDSPDLIAPARS
jgi:putative SOS response-associated peptidase YedK